MTDADRTYKQYIDVSIHFNEPQDPTAFWSALHKRGIAFKSYSNATYEATNFETNGTKLVHFITRNDPQTAERLVHQLPTALGDFETQLLDDLNIDYEYYTETHETTNKSLFVPRSFAFSNDAIANFPFIESWYSHQAKSGWSDDLRWQPDPELARIAAPNVNLLGFTASAEFDDDSQLDGLVLRLMLTTKGKTLLDDSEADTATILDYITTHVSEVADCDLVFGCHGEIEVEKQVSCARFATNNDNKEEE